MRLTLTCPYARYVGEMVIFCDKAKDYCGNAYFKSCKGWWALTKNADKCPLRKDESNEPK